MKTAKEILLEESKSDPNFGLLTGTMPIIERAMEKYAKQSIRYMLYNTEHSALDAVAHSFHICVSDFKNDEDYSTYPKERREFYEFVLNTSLQLLIDYFYCGKETERLFEIYNIKKNKKE